MNAPAIAAPLMAVGFTLLAMRRARLYGLPNRGVPPACIAVGACCALAWWLAASGRALGWQSAAIVACAAVCAATDVQWGYVFDPVIAATAGAVAVAALATGTLGDGLLGAAVLAGPLLLLFVAGRGRAIGFGDVKLAGVAGLALGPGASLGALWLACVSGGAVAAALLATGRARRGSTMPLGAFLALGIASAVCAGGAR